MLNSRIDEIYPEHARVLKLANLVPDKFPKIKNIQETIKGSLEKKKKTWEKRRKVYRHTYFYVGVCDRIIGRINPT